MPQKVQLYTKEVVLLQKNGLKRAFSKNLSPVKWQRAWRWKKCFLGGRPPPPPPSPMWPIPVLNHPLPLYPCKQFYWLVNHLREKAWTRRQFKCVVRGITGHYSGNLFACEWLQILDLLQKMARGILANCQFWPTQSNCGDSCRLCPALLKCLLRYQHLLTPFNNNKKFRL